MRANTWGGVKASATRTTKNTIRGTRERDAGRESPRLFFFLLRFVLSTWPLVRYDLNLGVGGGVEEDEEEDEEEEVSTWSGTTSRNCVSSSST